VDSTLIVRGFTEMVGGKKVKLHTISKRKNKRKRDLFELIIVC